MSPILFILLLITVFNQAQADELSCAENWIDCGNGKCVRYIWRCDGDNDCGNGKDEENCETNVSRKECFSSQFQCVKSGSCIPSTWHCDGEQDCDDGSDERNCEYSTRCPGFKCKDNRCIPSKWKCDGSIDCPDGSDEELCPKEICLESEFTCASGTCLDKKRVCDGKNDCSDASDEGRQCDDSCANMACSQKCRSSSSGTECYCNDGYKLEQDNQTCIDINECSNEGFCSQLCTNTIGSYSCSCLEGYEAVNMTCKASGSEPLLIFSTLQEIRALELRSKQYFRIQTAVTKASSVASDPVESRIYWVEISNIYAVYSSKLDGTGVSVVLNNGLIVPEGIGVDYVARNLYLTDSGLKQVLACKMDGTMCSVLHDKGIEKPRAIVLDLPEGMLYWSDWGANTSGIYRSGMDGSRRISLVSDNIKWPNGIALDHTTNRLFWTDASVQTIEYITLDGKTRKILMKGAVFHPYSLAVFEDTLYWSDWTSFSLDMCNKFTGHKTNVMTRESGKYIMGVTVHHPVLAKRSNNPCWENTCSHMCLIAPLSGFRCVCPPGFILSNNGSTCLPDDQFPKLFVNDETRIYQVKPLAVGSYIVEELPITHIGIIGSLAYDWNSKILFATDLTNAIIYAVNMTDWTKQDLVKNHTVTPVAIAFDWKSSNLYWVDSSKGTVEVISTVNSRSASIIADLSNPTAIALVPTIGRMFISVIGEDPFVAMYDMDGNNRIVLHTVMGIAMSLAVHPSESLLYWSDVKTRQILSVDYLNPKSEVSVVKRSVENNASITVSERFLYWTDPRHHYLSLQRHNTLYSFAISLPGVRSEIVARGLIYAEPVVTSVIQESADCSTINGGCRHLCLTSPEGRSCVGLSSVFTSDDVNTDKECTTEEFQCVRDKKCIPLVFVCDNVTNCDDHSDENCEEKPQQCHGNDFQCLNGRCILSSWKCDYRDDCGDNSDEIGCHTSTTCAKDQFSCGGSECIPSLWRCDGENDCTDSSDEADCHKTSCDEEMQMRCSNGQCIPRSWVCDGTNDCFDGTDEKDCHTNVTVTCKEGHHACNDGTCIYRHEVCDTYRDCPNGDDEINCTQTTSDCSQEEFFCIKNARCIPKIWLCDGDNDCGDAADEILDVCLKITPSSLTPYETTGIIHSNEDAHDSSKEEQIEDSKQAYSSVNLTNMDENVRGIEIGVDLKGIIIESLHVKPEQENASTPSSQQTKAMTNKEELELSTKLMKEKHHPKTKNAEDKYRMKMYQHRRWLLKNRIVMKNKWYHANLKLPNATGSE